MQDEKHLYRSFVEGFKFQPTRMQNELLKQLANYLIKGTRFSVFLLKGYAGTGKTTVISAIVNNLASTSLKSVLLAPTGRAAKVMGGYANKASLRFIKRSIILKMIRNRV